MFPGRWELIAELALGHASVRTVLQAEENNGSAPLRDDSAPLSTEQIITQLNSLHDLIGDGHARG